MSHQSTASPADIQSKLRCAASLVMDLLLPASEVATICREIDFSFRDRIYTPAVTVWMFIAQVLSADHSCQQAVTRLNGWRTARGLTRCSSETTSYCKARGRLPEKLFERLLDWTAARCNEAAIGDWLFHGREVDIVDGSTITIKQFAPPTFLYSKAVRATHLSSLVGRHRPSPRCESFPGWHHPLSFGDTCWVESTAHPYNLEATMRSRGGPRKFA